jgi:hypothetical protein
MKPTKMERIMRVLSALHVTLSRLSCAETAKAPGSHKVPGLPRHGY